MHMPYGMHRVRGACAHFFFNIYNNVTPRPGADGAEVQPRFNQDGVEAERAEVRQTLLPHWRGTGFSVAQAVERLWAGERDVAALTAGCDERSAALMRLVLEAADSGEVAARAKREHEQQHERHGHGQRASPPRPGMNRRRVRATAPGGRVSEAEVESSGDFRSAMHLRSLRCDFARQVRLAPGGRRDACAVCTHLPERTPGMLGT